MNNNNLAQVQQMVNQLLPQIRTQDVKNWLNAIVKAYPQRAAKEAYESEEVNRLSAQKNQQQYAQWQQQLATRFSPQNEPQLNWSVSNFERAQPMAATTESFKEWFGKRDAKQQESDNLLQDLKTLETFNKKTFGDGYVGQNPQTRHLITFGRQIKELVSKLQTDPRMNALDLSSWRGQKQQARDDRISRTPALSKTRLSVPGEYERAKQEIAKRKAMGINQDSGYRPWEVGQTRQTAPSI